MFVSIIEDCDEISYKHHDNILLLDPHTVSSQFRAKQNATERMKYCMSDSQLIELFD